MLPIPHAEHADARLHWSTDVHRSARSNFRLGLALSFIAGATNAGGLLAVGQYTSHMTGLLSSVADNLILGQIQLVVSAASAIFAFLFGAVTTAWIVNWCHQRQLRSAFARPLALEAILLLLFGIFGSAISIYPGWFVQLTVLVLCFIMGLQNAVITKISHAEIRTTHVTGLITDIGIELGKLLYLQGRNAPLKVVSNQRKLRIHLALTVAFLGGGVVGAAGFKLLGYVATVPLAILLIVLVWGPLAHDIRAGRFAPPIGGPEPRS